MSFSKNLNIHIKTINFWFSFVLFLMVISHLPHQPVPFLSWLNCSLYFLVFLQSLFLFKQNTSNKFIFLNIGIFALFHSLTFTNIFIGRPFLIKNDYLAYYLFEYRIIFLSFLFALCIIFICIKYLLETSSDLRIYLISFSILIPIFLWHYFPYLADKAHIFDIEDAVLYRGVLLFNLLPLIFLIFYGIQLYKHDRSLGAHINTIMVCFFIITIMDMTNLIGNIYEITIFSYTQYVLLVNLSFFLITMFRLLNHAYSDFGIFYDRIVTSGNHLGVPIKRKKNLSAAALEFVKAYFHHRRNTLGFMTLIFIFCINYFQASLFLKLNLAVISFCGLVLFLYFTALYEKRLGKGNLIKLKNNRLTN